MNVSKPPHSAVCIAWLVVAVAIAPATYGTATPAAPTLSLYEPQVTVAPGNDALEHRLVIVYEAAGESDGDSEQSGNVLKLSADAVPTVRLLGQMPQPDLQVDFGTAELLGRVGLRRYWTVVMTLNGLLDSKTAEIPLWLALGDQVAGLATLQVERPAIDHATNWTLTPPSDALSARPDASTELIIGATDGPLRDLQVLQSTIHNAATQERIGVDQLSLCRSLRPNVTDQKKPVKDQPSTHCEPIDVGKGMQSALQLAIRDVDRAGTFKGNVVIGPSMGASSKHFELTVYSRPGSRLIAGWALIVAGLVLVFVVNVWANGRLSRASALLPVARLTKRAQHHRNQTVALATKRDTALPKLLARLDEILSSLSVEHLGAHGLLPAHLANPFTERPAWAEKLKTHVEAQADVLAVLEVLVTEGLTEVDARWSQATQDACRAALLAIDERSSAADVETARQAVAKILRDLATEPHGAATRESSLAPPLSVERLTYDISRVSALVWGLWLIVTATAGAYLLIYQNPGFGTSIDLFKCFFWGVGFGIAEQTAEKLTPAAVATKFSVSFPKTAST